MSDENQYGSIGDMDDYVERRFYYNEQMKNMSTLSLIRIINRLVDRLDEETITLQISDQELEEIYNMVKEQEDDNE